MDPQRIGKALTVGEVAARSGVAVGVPLASIREALKTLPQDRAPTATEWRRLSSKWKAELDERITKLTQLRDQLDECIGCGCLSMRKCWLRNPWDELSRQGPGPRLLD